MPINYLVRKLGAAQLRSWTRRTVDETLDVRLDGKSPVPPSGGLYTNAPDRFHPDDSLREILKGADAALLVAREASLDLRSIVQTGLSHVKKEKRNFWSETIYKNKDDPDILLQKFFQQK